MFIIVISFKVGDRKQISSWHDNWSRMGALLSLCANQERLFPSTRFQAPFINSIPKWYIELAVL